MALQKTDKWKTKKWFTVYAPKAFNEMQIGEIPANDGSAVIGRRIKVGLNTLTNNPSNAYTNVFLKIVDVNGEAAHTKFVRMEQLYGYLRSLIRRYRSISDAVIPVTSKDNQSMVFKVIVVTRERTAHTRLMGMRKEMKEHIEAFAKENDSNAMISAVIGGKLQSELSAKLKHIASINKVEVKKLEIK